MVTMFLFRFLIYQIIDTLVFAVRMSKCLEAFKCRPMPMYPLRLWRLFAVLCSLLTLTTIKHHERLQLESDLEKS